MEDDILNFCISRYNEIYKETKTRLEGEVKNQTKNKTISAQKTKDIENVAQLEAIKATLIEGRLIYPSDIILLWSKIYQAHLFRKTGISDPTIIDKILAAGQSWKSSSGHAFEHIAKDLANMALEGTNIKFLLQKDLNDLLKEGVIANKDKDIEWLKHQVSTDNYDLYVIGMEDNKIFCFGCVQCKTSIRDRVSRDRELSAAAMLKFFWSISIVLDGSHLSTPKYMAMVNGGTETFRINGWHGMYDMSHTVPTKRIYDLDLNFDIIKNHALQAFKAWRADRQWFDHTWIAE